MSRQPEQRDRARQLRRAMTPAEAILWKHLRGRRLDGFKFRRQHPLDPFFADFACYECQLIIEVDGETHLGQESADQSRTRRLTQDGWLVLRFWNTELYDETEAVLEVIYQACHERKPPPHPQPLSPEAGARGGRTPHPQPLSPVLRGEGSKHADAREIMG